MNIMKASFAALVGILVTASLPAASLYDEATYRGLVSDHRAYRVGDTLMVVINESATAESTTDADTDKSLGVSVSASDGFNDITGNLNARNQFQGRGTLSRSDAVVATVSVTVQEVLPGGDLRVSGEQRIEFNEETQYISLKGRVRPVDISPQNIVLSSRLADARINYTGDGLLTDSQKPGIITRLFNWLF